MYDAKGADVHGPAAVLFADVPQEAHLAHIDYSLCDYDSDKLQRVHV